jgi:phosphoribosylglycinamide formyltransferase 1
MSRERVPVGVLISGSGTNLQALLDATADPDHPARIACVISNRRHARGLERARQAGVPALWRWHRPHPDREAYDRVLADTLAEHGVRWVALAGFMRIITPVLLQAFEGRVLNIHPSLLPAFPGLDGQGQAHAHGTTIAGATVHLVTPGVDAGPILAQGVVPALDTDTPEALRARILRMEHRLYPMCLRWAVEGRITVEGRRARVDLPSGDARALFDPTP